MALKKSLHQIYNFYIVIPEPKPKIKPRYLQYIYMLNFLETL